MTTIAELFGTSATLSPTGTLTVNLAELTASSGYDGDFTGLSGGKALAIIINSYQARMGDTSTNPDHSVSISSPFRSVVDRGGVSQIAFSHTLNLYAADTIGNLDPDNVL